MPFKSDKVTVGKGNHKSKEEEQEEEFIDDSDDQLQTMDLLVVLERNATTPSLKVIDEAAASAFGEVKVTSYDKFFVLEFSNRSKARKALNEGLMINMEYLRFKTMHSFLNSLN
ncbi:uncharacterized protein LOC119079316 [Bradysia coprophila]|uniref:uncharacterized protein LOC119079316 n=1 Tax=Bradysia coprophila TaxID=38358 RepID=UPI00187DC114|nr:uncharacterized protein LOC119079316 [Bradysia coprophila]